MSPPYSFAPLPQRCASGPTVITGLTPRAAEGNPATARASPKAGDALRRGHRPGVRRRSRPGVQLRKRCRVFCGTALGLEFRALNGHGLIRAG